MRLYQLGEFGLIDRLARLLGKPSKEVLVGIGDDAAVISPAAKVKSKELLLVTTDTLVENVHFRLKNISFFDLGCKALAANISDIAAMGGVPRYALITIGAHKNLRVEKVEELYLGIKHLAKKFKIEIIGGDTVQSPKELVLSITLLGKVENKGLVRRSGARVGDRILVTGKFGGPAAEEFKVECSKFKIRLNEARIISQSGLCTSMIDSSDGLVRSVIEICRASRVGARIWLGSIPVAPKASLAQALYGGEEYELVFTASKTKAEGLKNLIERKTGTRVSVVGEILKKKSGIKLVDVLGKVYPLRKGGYEHFK
jgi:thiamine-monophosphate kinase